MRDAGSAWKACAEACADVDKGAHEYAWTKGKYECRLYCALHAHPGVFARVRNFTHARAHTRTFARTHASACS